MGWDGMGMETSVSTSFKTQFSTYLNTLNWQGKSFTKWLRSQERRENLKTSFALRCLLAFFCSLLNFVYSLLTFFCSLLNVFAVPWIFLQFVEFFAKASIHTPKPYSGPTCTTAAKTCSSICISFAHHSWSPRFQSWFGRNRRLSDSIRSLVSSSLYSPLKFAHLCQLTTFSTKTTSEFLQEAKRKNVDDNDFANSYCFPAYSSV